MVISTEHLEWVGKPQAPVLGGLEPPTFRLTAERANALRHRDSTTPRPSTLSAGDRVPPAPPRNGASSKASGKRKDENGESHWT